MKQIHMKPNMIQKSNKYDPKIKQIRRANKTNTIKRVANLITQLVHPSKYETNMKPNSIQKSNKCDLHLHG